MISLLKPITWANFLLKYPKSGGLKIYYLIIVWYGAEQEYGSSFNTFIVSDNIISALLNPLIIKMILQEFLASNYVIKL